MNTESLCRNGKYLSKGWYIPEESEDNPFESYVISVLSYWTKVGDIINYPISSRERLHNYPHIIKRL